MGADAWTPQDVKAALRAGDLTAGEIDVRVGRRHACRCRGAERGRRYVVLPGDPPGATAADALAVATTPPG